MMRRFLALPLLSAEATKPVLADDVVASSPPTRVTFLDVPLSVMVWSLVDQGGFLPALGVPVGQPIRIYGIPPLSGPYTGAGSPA